MIEISLYRIRIGRFRPKCRSKNYFMNRFDRFTDDRTGKCFLKYLQICMKIVLIASFLPVWYTAENSLQLDDVHPHRGGHNVHHSAGHALEGILYTTVGKKLSPNFQARYKYGNKNQRGIKNIHLNIRSLGQKVFEVKNIISEQSPTIFGLSECQLKKVNNIYDEEKLKIPGYDLLFPKSWSMHGFARVVIYVKKSFKYEQIHDLEDDLVQSVWLKGGFKNSRDVYFCHTYREHTSTLGSSMAAQRNQLERFLLQWEEATVHHTSNEINEVHISGDMNLDALEGRWLESDYHLISLSRLVQNACNLSNFSQLVSVPTRFQYNRVRQMTDFSCIDHVYTNAKFRCSGIVVSPFGSSDHDVVGYTRYTKVPPAPARTMRKRSYKTFVEEDFLRDLRTVDWSEVYQSDDPDTSTEIFTRKFIDVLNLHAPWIVFQQRKHYKPWITENTKELIKNRDNCKKVYKQHVIEGNAEAASEAWNKFKKVRNKINNKKKFEERNFKSEKLINSLDSPAHTWSTAKSFMNWKSTGGPPHQLSIAGKLITKASSIAKEMNHFFLDKVKIIREGIRYHSNSFSKCKEVMENKNCSLSLKHVTVVKVNKLLKGLKNSKSTAIDELDNFCVKIAADIIDRPLHHIITLSIIKNKFPRGWKFSKVIPLHKKLCALERKNYRPVSILSPLSKILEKVVYEQIYEYFSKNKIFHPNLHGYRQHRSTQTALLTMYDRWVKEAVEGQVSGAVTGSECSI